MKVKKNLQLTTVEKIIQTALDVRKRGFLEVGRALRLIFDGNLWTQNPSYTSYTHYLYDRWGMSYAKAYGWRKAVIIFDFMKGKICPNLTDDEAIYSGKLPFDESHAFKLATLLKDEKNPDFSPIRDVWKIIQLRVKQGEKLTGPLIDEEVTRWKLTNIKQPLNRNRRRWYLHEISLILKAASRETDPQICKMRHHLSQAIKILSI